MSIKHILPGNIGLGGAPLGNMFRNIPEDEAHATVAAASIWAFVTSIPHRCTAPVFLKSGWVKRSRNTLATSSF